MSSVYTLPPILLLLSITSTDFDEVVKLDSEYIRNWHIGLDIKIIWKTLIVLIDRKKNKAI